MNTQDFHSACRNAHTALLPSVIICFRLLKMSQGSYCSQRPMPTRTPPILHKDLALGTKSLPQAEEPGWGSNGMNKGWLSETPFERSFRLTQRKDEKEIRPHWTRRRTHTVLKSGARSYTVQIPGENRKPLEAKYKRHSKSHGQTRTSPLGPVRRNPWASSWFFPNHSPACITLWDHHSTIARKACWLCLWIRTP